MPDDPLFTNAQFIWEFCRLKEHYLGLVTLLVNVVSFVEQRLENGSIELARLKNN